MAGEEERKKILSAIVKRKILSATLTWTGVFLFFVFFSVRTMESIVMSITLQLSCEHIGRHRNEVMVSSVVQAVLTVGKSHTMELEASWSYREAANGSDTTHPTYPSWEGA